VTAGLGIRNMSVSITTTTTTTKNDKWRAGKTCQFLLNFADQMSAGQLIIRTTDSLAAWRMLADKSGKHGWGKKIIKLPHIYHSITLN
jgi:hypothetical protein